MTTSEAPYEGRHRVPDDRYWFWLGVGAVRDQHHPHTPRHSAKPPRIPQPSHLGVVEAAAAKSPGRHEWVRQGDLWWNGSAWNEWGSLIDPVLIREGVES